MSGGGADVRDGSVAGAQSVRFFVALVLYGDPDPPESGVRSQPRNE